MSEETSDGGVVVGGMSEEELAMLLDRSEVGVQRILARQEEERAARTREAASRGDRRVCACGHAMGKHTTSRCLPNGKNVWRACNCRDPKPVLSVWGGDLMLFQKKSDGSLIGGDHALWRGLVALQAGGLGVGPAGTRRRRPRPEEIKWLVDACEKCARVFEDPSLLIPVNGRALGGTETSAALNFMLCHECVVKLLVGSEDSDGS